jgi:SAM-dependent methyltransferase
VITVDFSRLALPAGARILDVGCGSGRHAAEAARIPHALVVGSDLRRDDLLQAEERLAFHRAAGETGGGTEVLLNADLTALPLKDELFDLVICSEVLEHITDHGRAADELVRVARPGARVAVSVPRYLPERICWALSEDYRRAEGGHVRIYRPGEIIALLENRGLTLTGRGRAHALHSPYWWIKCACGPDRENALVRKYHDLLVWDMMKKPRLTRTLERLLNPVLGKSLVLYFRKG